MRAKQKTKLIVIVGPTAVGKSDIAVRVARQVGGEVISADSRQVYRGLNMGTGKVTKKEMKGVPHHLLDVASPRSQFSVASYVGHADKAIAAIIKRGKVPIVAGGTGFYVAALLRENVIPDVPPVPKIRKELETLPAAELMKKLKTLDKRRAGEIDPNNKRRIIRAIEVAQVRGSVPPAKKIPSSYAPIKIGIKADDIKERIKTRLKRRIRGGLIKEGRDLHAKGLSYKRMEELGLEYKYLALLLRGKLSRDQFEDELSRAIAKYAKRQMTWFKRDREIKWFAPSEVNKIEKYVAHCL